MSIHSPSSWGYTPPIKQRSVSPSWVPESFSELPVSNRDDTLLPFGSGRSYGDSCLNSAGCLIDTRGLNRFIAFDSLNGLLTVEPGVTLADILALIVSRGWFLPVTPGTSFVTLGGAIANDVHGKNHHADGCFGRHIREIWLMRSNDEIRRCSNTENHELFSATIGGLGLTGLITQATIQLIPIRSDSMDVRIDTFHGLSEFAELSNRYKQDYRYTVAWLDCTAGGANFARGVFLAANHSEDGDLEPSPIKRTLSVPFALPSWLLNRYSIRAFNTVYFKRHQVQSGSTHIQHYKNFFYPLDAINNWNRIYGNAGFHQYQFVVPLSEHRVLQDILRKIVDSGMGSFLSVLKEFGDLSSPGMLSFPRSGYCLALDFANRGERTKSLIRRLDNDVRSVGGAAYPAKDRLMTSTAFREYFPQWQVFSNYVDPRFRSDFWARVND